MSTLLERCGIEPLVGYDPAHLEPPPDLVVVGNAVRRDNPEAMAVEARGLERLSMPEAVARFFLADRRPLVTAGTHGKTTTSSIAAWVWTEAGADPGYLIGGAPCDLPSSFALGTGERFIIEGDEYNAAYFDRGPKFLHYRPETLILTSMDYDHADLYPDPADLRRAYEKLVALLPEDGLLVAAGDSEEIRQAVRQAPCETVLYGFGDEVDVHPVGGVEEGPEGTRLRLHDPAVAPTLGQVELHLQMPGRHNLANALGVWVAAVRDGLEPHRVARALGSFRGVQRRLEEIGTRRSVTVIDDFAHHPTAVEASLTALRKRHPGRRLTALFEPRSLTSGRSLFHRPYLEAFSHADRVLFAPTFHADRLEEHERLSFADLVAELRGEGVEAFLCSSNQEVFERAVTGLRADEVVVTMSSGAFDGMPRRLLAALDEVDEVDELARKGELESGDAERSPG